MSEPWGDNSRPPEGCGFCSDFQRMKDNPEVCFGCPHDPDADATSDICEADEVPVDGA